MNKILQVHKGLTKIMGLMLLLSLSVINQAYANYPEEDVKVRGKVLDERGEGLPGATILVQGTSTGTTTDLDGKFMLSVDEEATLVVSFIGYATQEIALNGRSIIDVTLVEDLGELAEVVVVGYMSQDKASLTTAISEIGNESIQTTNHTSLAQKLQGKVAGLQIRQTSGQPGVFDNDISIRGFGNPLYVIDGIRREGAGEFQQLNANDIESISVLKDASAAIYGLGAANGVILVTTKKGSKGAPKFTFGMNFGILEPTDIPDMASAGQYVEMFNDAQVYLRDGERGVPFYSQEEVDKWNAGVEPGYQGTDWYDLTMKDRSNFQQYNASISGGSDKLSYYMGLEHLSENGLLRSEDMGYKRYNLRTNITSQLGRNLEGQLLVGVRNDQRNQPGSSFFGIFKGTRVSRPIDQPYANNNPEFLTPIFLDQNPLAFAERDVTGYSEDRTQSLQSSFSLEYKVPFVEGLSVKTLISYDLNNFQNKNLAKPYFLYNHVDSTDTYNRVKYRDGSGNISQRSRVNQYLTFQTYINYERKFGSKHSLNTVLVYEDNRRNREDFRVTRFYDDFYTKDVLRFAGLRHESDSDPLQEADISYIARVNYSYDKKYLLDIAARYMGSYRYAPSSRWEVYPMISAGWRVSEESFFRENVKFVSNLKFRGSIGVIGQPQGIPFQFIDGFELGSGGAYEFVDGEQIFGIASPPPANDKLSWRENTTMNIGLDMGLWDNKVTITTDVFQRNETGIAARRSIDLPDTYGGQLPEENLNSNMNRGIELAIGTRGRIGKVDYGVTGNYTLTRSRDMIRVGEAFTNSYSQWRNQQSNRDNGFVWAYNHIGQFQNEDDLRSSALQNGRDGNIMRALPGDFKYEDVNGDGLIDGDDMSPSLADDTPRAQFGLNVDVFWKGFDFNMLWQGQMGHTIRFREVYGQIFAFRGNTPAYFHDRWRQEDPSDTQSEWIPGEWPVSREIQNMPGLSYAESSAWRRDASYVRLKSVQLGYTIKSDLISKIGIESMRLYTTGFNLLTFTDPWVKPHDPEKTNNGPGLGFDAGFGYPLARTYTVGLNINF